VVARLTRPRLVEAEPLRMTGEAMFHLVEGEDVRALVLDFSRVELVSSSMLAKLYRLQQTLQAAGGRLVLCCLRPQVAQMFEATDLAKLFQLLPTEAEARNACSMRPA
jgi:anti-sigma B factor antagonist